MARLLTRPVCAAPHLADLSLTSCITDLLNYLNANKLKTTFFVVGSRAISRPDVLQAEYMSGHQVLNANSHPLGTVILMTILTLSSPFTRGPTAI